MFSLEPGARIDRYVVEGPLGQGGMADVFRAFDPKLGRRIALKRIGGRGVDAVSSARLMREARAAAALDHPNVVAIFDVGEFEGAPYIAMELVVGAPLRRYVGDARVSMRRRVAWLVEIARALSAAHACGLVHCDIKPENVMVRSDDVVKVVDFGIARATADAPGAGRAAHAESASGVSRDDVIAGTALYMAPEQARGGVVGARADQFAWGMLAHELLSGVHPWGALAGAAHDKLFAAILYADVPSLEHAAPEVPPRVAYAVARALAKSPESRFETMDDLIEAITDIDSLARTVVATELTAMTTATTIEAHVTPREVSAKPPANTAPPITVPAAAVTSRLGARLRRHAVSVAVTLAAAALSVAGWRILIRVRADSAEQEHAAMRLGEGAARLEAIARRSALLPLHDTRRERAEMAAEMRRVESETMLKPSLVAAGSYVLGRGYLALRDPARARTELERAAASTHEARVEEALGEALGELYRAALVRAQRAPVAVRDSMMREAETTLRNPALSHLRDARGSGGDPERLEGLIALYEGRFDDATRAAREASARDPMAFEAKELEGDVEFAKARDLREGGLNLEANLAFERAGEAWSLALSIARSSTTLYTKQVRRASWQLNFARQIGHLPSAHYAYGMEMADKAIVVDPEDALAWRARAEVAQYMAGDESVHGLDPMPTFAIGVTSARRAVALAPDDDDVRRTLADILNGRGEHERRHGLDPTASLEEAIREYETVLSRGSGDAWYFNGLGGARKSLILYLSEQDIEIDPRPGLLKAVDDYAHASERYPSWASPRFNASNVLRQVAEQDLLRGVDPRPTLDRAADAADAALRVEPSSVLAACNRALVDLRRGEAATMRGDDPSADFEAAMTRLDDAHRRDPTDALTIQDRGNVWLARADEESRAARDPLPAVREAVLLFEERARIDPGSYWARRQTAEAWRIAAIDAVRRGNDPHVAIQEAERAIDAALRTKANDFPARALAAEMALIAAQSPRADATSRRQSLSRAEALASAITANEVDALRVMAGVHRERARLVAERRGDPAAEVRATVVACAQIESRLPGDARARALRGAARMIDARARGDAEAMETARADIETAIKRDARLARDDWGP